MRRLFCLAALSLSMICMGSTCSWAAAGDVLWTFDTGSGQNETNFEISCPSIADDGIICFGSTDTYCYAVNPDGTLKWKYKTQDKVYSAPVIDARGTIYFASRDGYLYALDSKGTLLWKTRLSQPANGPVIGYDGMLYLIGDNVFYAVSQDGEIEVEKVLSYSITSVTPVIDAKGDLCYSASRNNSFYLVKINNKGDLLWASEIADEIIHSTPAIDSDGTLYVASMDKSFYAVNPDGSLKWDYVSDGWTAGSPSIGENGDIYFQSSGTYSINQNGSKNWRANVHGYSCTVVGADGTIYAGSNNGIIAAISSTGAIKWECQTNAVFVRQVCIDENGVLYGHGDDRVLYAIDTGTNSGLADSPWPKYQGNNKNTGAVPPQIHTVSGTVLYNGSSLVNTIVTVTGTSIDTLVTTDADGIYTLTDKIGGSVTVTPKKVGYTFSPESMETNVAFEDVTADFIASSDPQYIFEQEIAFARIPAGNFEMGNVDGNSNEKPVHSVFQDAFYVSGTEITQKQYKDIAGEYNSQYDGDEYPARIITWQEAASFCNKMSDTLGYEKCYDETTWICDFSKNGIRLPTEAEWEYVCKSGAQADYFVSGDSSDLKQIGWFSGNSGDTIHIVGLLEPNAYGLYDLFGNVWELTYDWYGSYDNELQRNPSGPDTASPDTKTVIRGGSVGSDPKIMTASHREASITKSMHGYDIGFRIARSLFTIEGTISDEFGNPVNDAEILITAADIDTMVTSNADGFYTLSGLEKGTYTLTPAKTGYAFDQASYTVVTDSRPQIADLTAKAYLTLTSPLGGETWDTGTEQQISWNSNHLSTIRIEYSDNGGTDWIAIEDSYDATVGSYTWTVPDLESTRVLVRVTDTIDAGVTDRSDATLTVTKPLIFELTFPSGGERWLWGQAKTITWNAHRIDKIRIEYTPDGGTRWMTVATSVDASLGSYEWTVPNVESTNCKIRITDTSDAGRISESGGFTITESEEPGTILWSVKVGDSIDFSTPAISENGTVYICSNEGSRGKLSAINPDGGIEWSYKARDSFKSTSPVIGLDGTIYFGCQDGCLYAVLPDGTEKWRYQTSGQINCVPTTNDTYIIVKNSKNVITAVSLTGEKDWELQLKSDVFQYQTSPIIAADGTIYVASQEKTTSVFYAINPDGTIKWELPLDGVVRCLSPSINNDNVIFIGSDTSNDLYGTLYAINPDGSIFWKYNTYRPIWSSPCIDGKSVYFQSDGVFALNFDGSVYWKNNLHSYSSPAIAQDGTLYTIADNQFKAFNRGGATLRFSIDLDDNTKDWNSVALNDNGVAYAGGALNGNLYAVYTGSKDGLADTSWPKFHGNLRNTGSIQDEITVEKSLTITSPDGGDIWHEGSMHSITWTSTGILKVAIEYTLNGGTTWNHIASDFDASRGEFVWMIPSGVHGDCKIRICDEQSNCLVVSPVFSIAPSVSPPDEYGTVLASSTDGFRTTDWSPDGKWIAYDAHNENGMRDSYIVSADGTEIRNLTQSFPQETWFSQFTPDSKSVIVTIAGSSHRYDLKRVDIETKTITTYLGNACNGRFSADGRYMVYRVGDTSELAVYDTVTKSRDVVSGRDDMYAVPCFMPDGLSVVTTMKTGGSEKLFRIPLDGSDPVQLTNAPGYHWYPEASPDGRYIFFHRFLKDPHLGLMDSDLMIYDVVNDVSVEVFPDLDDNHGSGSFSPDMSMFSFRRTADGVDNVYKAPFEYGIPANPTITLTSPNGGERFVLEDYNATDQCGCHGVLFTWTSTDIENVKIEIQYASGMPWQELETCSANLGKLIYDGVFNVSDSAKFRISDVRDSSTFDESDNVVTFAAPLQKSLTLISPNGGEVFSRRPSDGYTEFKLTWEATGVSNIKIELINDEAHTSHFEITPDASLGQIVAHAYVLESQTAYFRISDANDSSISDKSDASFTIKNYEAPALSLTFPNGGEKLTASGTESITWQSFDVAHVKIEYTTDNGASWITVVERTDSARRMFSWVLPDIESSACRIKISNADDASLFDESDASFTIQISQEGGLTMLFPSGGERWAAGSQQTLRWQSEGIDTVNIEYSLDNGESWTLIADDVPSSQNTYSWQVPAFVSSECFIRVTDADEPETFDVTDAVFEIYEPEISIIHTPITSANENQKLVLTAQIVGGNDVKSVTLYYDKPGCRKFDKSQSFSVSGESEYTVTIQANVLTALGLEYYIVAEGNDGTVLRSPANDEYYSITTNVNNAISSFHVPAGVEINSYRMISVPLQLTRTSITDQLQGRLPPGEAGYDWRIFQYVNSSAGYREYPDIDGFTPGEAYWIIVNSDSGYNLTVGDGCSVDTSVPYQITLKPGWNLIGNPWMFPVSWDDMDNPSGAALSVLYSYDGGWSDPTDPPTILEPWQGYAVKNQEAYNVGITLQPTNAGSSAKIAEKTMPEMMARLTVEAGNASDISNYFGVNGNANVQWDAFDHVEPPLIGSYVSLTFPHEDWDKYPGDYTVDIRPEESSDQWDFNVTTNIAGEEVTVCLEWLQDVNDDSNITIFDRDNKTRVPLDNGEFSFVSGSASATYHFTLLMNETPQPGEHENQAVPNQYVLTRCFPNPFNPSTTISYTLPQKGDVRLFVYNTVGQLVVSRNLGVKAQGVHEYVFNAEELTSGMYIYRIDAGYSSATDKMMFMK